MRHVKVPSALDLPNMTCTAAKIVARQSCPQKTDQELAEETSIPRSTLASMLSSPKYHPALPNVPIICEALGNDIIIEWQAAQRGGYVVFPPFSSTPVALQQYIADISRKFSDVLENDAKARLATSPGRERYTLAELNVILRELNQLGKKVAASSLMIEGMIKGAKRK